MRIVINTVFLTSQNLGGSWTYTANLVWHISNRAGKHEVIVLVNPRTAGELPVSSAAGRTVVVPVDPESRAMRVGWEHVALRNIVRKERPDVFHAPGNILPFGIPCKNVVTVHDLQYLHYPANFHPLRRWYLKAMMPISLRRADRIICDSEFTRQDVLRAFPVSEGKVSVVHLGGLVDKERAHGTTDGGVLERLGISRPYILSVGSSLPHKNLGRMIEAFVRIAGDIPHSLVVVGEGFKRRSELLQTVAGAAVGARVKFLDFLPRADLLSLYRGADAFVFPSLFEGFGIPAIEAMDCGCPVVASRATSIPEVVGDAGVFFNPDDMADMSSTILRVCSDQTLRDSLRARGRVWAAQFSWQRMADETIAVYEQLHVSQPDTK